MERLKSLDNKLNVQMSKVLFYWDWTLGHYLDIKSYCPDALDIKRYCMLVVQMSKLFIHAGLRAASFDVQIMSFTRMRVCARADIHGHYIPLRGYIMSLVCRFKNKLNVQRFRTQKMARDKLRRVAALPCGAARCNLSAAIRKVRICV